MANQVKWDFRGDFIGLSTEAKPNNEVDGSTYYEVDTGKFYILYNGTWYLQGEQGEQEEQEESVGE